jgi:hypothetical protein
MIIETTARAIGFCEYLLPRLLKACIRICFPVVMIAGLILFPGPTLICLIVWFVCWLINNWNAESEAASQRMIAGMSEHGTRVFRSNRP